MPGLVKIGMTTQEYIDIAPQRINQNREFFRIQVEQAKAILELFHHTDVTEEVSDEIQNDLTDDDKAASVKAQIHRPPLNFCEMGLQKGDILVWKDAPTVTYKEKLISDIYDETYPFEE